jgi:hypothetical protein
MSLNYDTTWVGLVGGGLSGSVVAGGSVYQIDIWNMGGNPLPARVLVTGKRVGVVAEAGAGHAMLIATGCKKASEMDGIKSSGLDWEFAAGLKGSALVKTGASLFEKVISIASSNVAEWAIHESTKRFVQWTMDDLGIIKPGKQFNLLPSPLSISIGAGIFYDWQTLKLLGGNVGWQHISPEWYMENVNGGVRLQIHNIPEQDGALVKVGIAISEWGMDPYIRWKKKNGQTQINSQHSYQILGYAFKGKLYEECSGKGVPGINLTNLQPMGQLQTGWTSVTRNNKTNKNRTLNVRPVVFKFSNYPYWTADDTTKINVGFEGCFKHVYDAMTVKS